MFICSEPVPDGIRMTWPGGRPDPICSMSRIIRSMPVRSELLTPVISTAASRSFEAWLSAVAVAPITTVMMPIDDHHLGEAVARLAVRACE